MRNREKFAKWLQNEMSNRNWSQSDLARNAGLHRAIISKLVLGASTPQPDTLLAIATALKLPETQVFEAAGILPSKENKDNLTELLDKIFNKLPDEEKNNVIEFAKHRQELANKRKKNEEKSATTTATAR